MLGLLTPAWLIGLASLSVPIALHLWSRRGGRPIRVGSIRLLLGTQPATRRHWATQDLPLLLVRCATLATLVLALAGPYWAPRIAPGRRWALVASDVGQRAALVDSLTRAGLDVHPLGDSTSPGGPQNLWAALRQVDRVAPRGTRFEVFAPDRLRYFRGERPAIAAAVAWHVRAPAGPAATPPVRAAPRLVTIFADADRSDDARYVTAAFRAAGGATGIPAIVTRRATAAALEAAAGSDWVVWLSSRPVPGAVLERVRRGATVLTDAAIGAPRGDYRSRMLFVDQPSDAWVARSSATADSGAPLWTDGSGRPLLTMTREGLGLHYRFDSRFHPRWSDLVLRGAFPEALARVWIGPDSAARAGVRGDRRLALSQLLPARDTSARTDSPGVAPEPRRSLFIPVWLLALAWFGFERWLAARPRRRPA